MPTQLSYKRFSILYWSLWGALLLFYLAWPLTHLDAYAWSTDEGLYVQRAALANAGYPLYTETLLNKPPLLVWLLQLAFQIGGHTLPVARLTVLPVNVMGVIALGALASQLWGRWASVTTAILFVSLAEVPVRAHAVMADLPAMSFMLLAVAAALLFRRTGNRFWLLLIALGATASLLIHPLMVYMALPLTVILLFPKLKISVSESVKELSLNDAALLAGVGLGAGLLVLAFIDRSAFFSWVFTRNYEAAQGVDWLENGRWIIETLRYLLNNPG